MSLGCAEGGVRPYAFRRCPRPAPAAFVLILCCALCALTPARSYAQEESKRGEFGSSLERLRWDPLRKATVGAVDDVGADAGVADEDEVVRIESALVTTDVLVLDRAGRTVRGLTQKDFIVTEEGRPQPISTFAAGDDALRPRSIISIIDYSGSQLPYLDTSIAAAKVLVDQLHPADSMAIVTDEVSLLLDFTQDKARLKQALESLKGRAGSGNPSGASRQYSALMAALKELVVGRERPIVIFQTDGDELPSLQPLPPDVQVERAKAALRAQLRATLVGGPPASSARGRERNVSAQWFNLYVEQLLRAQTALQGLSKLTGGWAEHLEEPGQATQVYARILSDINNRYVLGFQPTNRARDGRRHKVSIEVRGHPEYVVRGRKAYYAPGR